MDPLLVGATGAQVASQSGDLGTGQHYGGQTNEQMFQQYRGAIPVQPGKYGLVKAEDPEHMKPVKRFRVYAKVFYLEKTEENVPDGIVAYQKTLQDIYDAEAGAEIIACEIKPPENGAPNWTAFLQWRTAVILPASEQGSIRPASI